MRKLLMRFIWLLLLLIVVHVFLINYTFNLDTNGISRNKIDVIWHSDDYDLPIVKKGISIMFVPPTYGPSYFKVHIKNGPTFEVGNWRTNVWDIPDYDIKLTKTLDKYILEFTANDTDYRRVIEHYNLKGKLVDTAKSYYKNGKVKYLKPYKNGELNGISILYLPDGKIDKLYLYNNGKLIEKKSFVKDSIGDIIYTPN